MIDPAHLAQALANAALAYEAEITEDNDCEKISRLNEHRIQVNELDEATSFFHKP